MHSMRTTLLTVLSVGVLSCTSVAPVRVATGEQCFRCRRPIINTRFAAETIAGDRSRIVTKFRGPGCMAKYLAAHPNEEAVVFVTDYASGRMIAPAEAFYVIETIDRNTRETEYRAYGREADAKSAAAQLNTTLVSWNSVLEQAR